MYTSIMYAIKDVGYRARLRENEHLLRCEG